ncbi:adenylate/guanylate cyclase domain-containing protein [Shimia sediminis]|uniref:adenylate/guanylate cyclase domain-containing protein n=1 Tax=Shimia sediminis TaxID=2497945 RepID=UPI000F8D3406|nr:adenylate/guanylate cyclase domain-containing protein [Shimia sediminis]
MELFKAPPDPVTPKNETNRKPHWVKRLWRWYSYREDSTLSSRHKRAVLLMAVISPIIVVAFWSYAAYYLTVDAPNLWPAVIVCFLSGFPFLIQPALFRHNVVLGCFAMLLFGGVPFTIMSYLFGADAGLNLGCFNGAILALMVLGTRNLPVLAVIAGPYLGLALALPILFPEPALSDVTPELQRYVYQSTVLAVIGTGLLALYFAVRQVETAETALEAEHALSETLLYNLLPTEIANRLKDAPGKTIADSLDHTAILFADIVGFTPRSAKMTPEELVGFLNRIFSTFDTLAEKHRLEKIKTIGDAYMVAAGLPQPVDQPVHRVAAMAFDMLDAMRAFSDEIGDRVEIRIGIHAGPVVAGVIGHQKLFYDVWGDTVNTASRMESHGQAGRIQVTDAARKALKEGYTFEPRGSIEIKGIGALDTWWLGQNA